ncbi:MAG TPA: class I SAM-dependent methyltransferase [Micromonosporaceae bacterium]|nr:class I SAM-dependent methyltransferase [Micromonosporaceae bacterium]
MTGKTGDGPARSVRPPTPQALFTRVAPIYDLVNGALSLGLDRSWRRRAVSRLALSDLATVLDVACGTGAMGAALRRHAPTVQISGIDANTAMLARNRSRSIGYAELVEGTVERLPFADASFDAVMIGFAFHDFSLPDQACRELHRVLRPGGCLVDLELTVPTARPLRAGYLTWLKVFGLLSRSRRLSGYGHLQDEVRHSPDDTYIVERLAAAGFKPRETKKYTGGIATCYLAEV